MTVNFCIQPAGNRGAMLMLCICLIYAAFATAAIAELSPDEPNSEPIHLPSTDNLQQLASRARENNQLLLLMVSQSDCSYCVVMREEVLGPMLRSGDYREQMVILELMIDYGHRIKNFTGDTESVGDFAHRYRADITPTLLFLSPSGKELVEKMVGIQTPEMLYHYVDQSVQRAIGRLGRDTKSD